jgi:hypothetical protein
MVKHLLAGVVALSAITLGAPHAHAHPQRPDDYEREVPVPVDVPDDDDQPAFNMFGFDMSIGVQPHDGANALAMSIGLGVEHPVFKKTRVFGEYAWMWLLPRDRDPRAQTSTAPRPDRDANGHRVSLGLRRELKAKESGSMRMFIDGELGGSVALVHDSMDGTEVLPAAFVGMRFGYDLYSRRDDSPSRTFETALLLRTVATHDGVGMTFGLGMFWGN